MKYTEFAYTASSITKLEEILSIMPEDRVVERLGLEHMLKKEKQRLEGVAIPPRPKITNVTFEGTPVEDGAGIDANFAARTAKAFTEATAIAIAGSTGDLEDTGGIPHRALGQQLISGVTTGSFGFEIELAPDTVPEGRLRPEVSISERAVAMIQDLLQGALDASDDDLAELAGSLHPRAVNKIAEFVRILNNSGAQVSLGLNDRKVALRTPQDVDRANSRLAPRNIVETTSARTGTLIGMVPSRRTFELRERDTGVPIQGRIGHELEAPYRMAATYTNRDVIASIRQVRAGRSQPQYTLLEIVGLANPNERL